MTDTTNRLAAEKSPYLLQHARNPVNWYPWGEAAFAKARAEDKPVFLSIGYSTCHWCHVMERESFEDPETAGLLNEHVVAVKVDREERPDLDSLYMAVSQLMTGSGGWPLTILMTPDRDPFFAATYIPRQSSFGRMGLVDLIPRLTELWTGQRAQVYQAVQSIRGHLSTHLTGKQGSVEPKTRDKGFAQLAERFDREHGGFGTRPKFPSPHTFLFLLDHFKRAGSREALSMVTTTLSRMRRGGIFDQIGHGFHRYSTDREWLLPHFEKMLYDQALLVLAYVQAFDATGEEEFAGTARETIGYVLRELCDAGGGFYCGEDADSEGEEGRFYVWTEAELLRILGPDRAGLARKVYATSEEGNFEDEATGRRTGTNILYLRNPLEKTAQRLGLEPGELKARKRDMDHALLEARSRRVHPHLDDKILTDWNGLMVAALARAGRVLKAPEYIDAATRCVQFLKTALYDDQGSLLHRYRDGEAAIPAMADDYAFLAWGRLELHRATDSEEDLQACIALCRELLESFRDQAGGGLFLNRETTEPLPARPREYHDGALPSANSVAAYVFAELAKRCGDESWRAASREILESNGAAVSDHPSAYAMALLAVEE
jgi:hypothetical protein